MLKTKRPSLARIKQRGAAALEESRLVLAAMQKTTDDARAQLHRGRALGGATPALAWPRRTPR